MRAVRPGDHVALEVALVKASAKRIRPRAPARARVGSSRDLSVLGDIALSGMLTTGQIERLAFPSRRRAQRRLRAYLDHGLVRACLQGEAMHLDSVWTVTSGGLEFLADRGAAIQGVRPYRPNARSQKLSHGLLVREVTVSLLIAERAGLLALEDLRHDSELGGVPAFQAAGVVPDGLALARRDGRAVPLVWEAVSLRQPLGQVHAKLLAYERAVAGGNGFFRQAELAILFAFESRRRLERFSALAVGPAMRERVHALALEEVRDARGLVERLMPGTGAFRPVR